MAIFLLAFPMRDPYPESLFWGGTKRLWGCLAGSMLPFLLRRFGLDPATSSAPFVATLVDVTGLLIYFNVALFFLRGTLL
jgi:Mg/Co/Ni transporter MgtE